MPTGTNGAFPVLGEGNSPEPVETEVDQRLLVVRQIRLYIENTPDYVAFAVPAFAVALAGVWPFVPNEHPKLVLWGVAHFIDLFARFVAWVAFRRANPNDEAIRSWLKWFFVPSLSGGCVVGASAILFLPALSGNDIELTFALGAIITAVALVGAMHAAAYRPLVAPVVAATILISIVGFLQVPGTLSILMALAVVFMGLFAYRLASKLNQAFVRSIELSIRNERLTLAAEKANLAKTRFLAAASHDLRQPMHTIGLLVGIMRDRKSDRDDNQLVDKVHAAVLSMENLFTGLLDISKLDAGVIKPNIGAFPLASLLEAIRLNFTSQAQEKRLRFRVRGTNAIVGTDVVMLERIVANLVSNAIRYTRKGGVLVGYRRKGKAVRIEVWDTDIGIPQEQLDAVFQEFFQLDNPERDRSKGLGLGLSIVKRSASLLGLPVRVKSTPGRGSCFSVEVPLASKIDTPGIPIREGDTTSDVLFGSFILVIDDEHDVRFAMQSILERWGCHTLCVASVDEAIEQLRSHLRAPDLIISDYQLRESQTGIEALDKLRDVLGEQPPAIIITGDIAAGDIQQLSRLGLPLAHKPVSPEQLRRLVIQTLPNLKPTAVTL